MTWEKPTIPIQEKPELPFVPRGEERYSAGEAWKCLLE